MEATHHPLTAESTGRLSGLDGLRAVAVLLVFLFHDTLLGCGWIGVQIFFVLSGYLITRLLYRAKGVPFGQYLREFYGRRSLRIFPVYFALLTLFWTASRLGLEMHGLRAGLPFAYTYTYNWYHTTAGFEHSRLISHFWSLCVEEQFYLVWPCLIFFCPPRRIKLVLSAIVLAGPAIRGAEWMVLNHFPQLFLPERYVALYAATPTHLDAFAVGALASLFPPRRAGLGFLLTLLAVVIGGIAVSQLPHAPDLVDNSFGYPLGLRSRYEFIWGYTLLNVLGAFAIVCLVQGRLRAFELPPLRYLGKISYGFYLFHYPFESLLEKVMPHEPLGTRMVIQLVATIAVSSLSFHLFEARFLALKDRWFPLRPVRPAPAMA